MAKINFGGTVEDVVTREEFSLDQAREVLKNEVVAVIGYGVQGPAQSLNMRDNGINVIVSYIVYVSNILNNHMIIISWYFKILIKRLKSRDFY